jgi:hypothetical protein
MNIMAETALLSFEVDREHSALRFGVAVLFVVICVMVFIVVNTILPSAGFNIIAGIVALVAAAIAGRIIEPMLKARWPSGRKVEIDSQGVRLILRNKLQIEVRADEDAALLRWRFVIPRRSRMPKGWLVVACAVVQNDSYLPVYTFASPQQADALSQIARFSDLASGKESSKASSESLRVAGEQRRLRLAEQHRWNDGAEMTFADFEQFVTHLNTRFPLWQT